MVGGEEKGNCEFPAVKFTPTLCSFPLMGDKTWPGGATKNCRIRQTMDNSQHIHPKYNNIFYNFKKI